MNTFSRRTALKSIGTAALVLPVGSSLPTLAFAPSSHDEYIMKTLVGGTFSLGTSELAPEKSSSDIVTGFANLEIGEAKAVEAALVSTGTMPPAETDSDKTALMEKLMGLEGGDFDAAHIDGQLTAHEELLAIQEPMAEMAEITIPVANAKLAREFIDTHIAMLEGIERMM